MSGRRAVLFALLLTDLGCGFLHHLGPPGWRFERPHILLFNLCGGGALPIQAAEGGGPRLSRRRRLFLLLALGFSFSAFFQWYAAAALPLLLAVLVEQTRIDRFGRLFPRALFSRQEPVEHKLHQAALLCLSLRLLLAGSLPPGRFPASAPSWSDDRAALADCTGAAPTGLFASAGLGAGRWLAAGPAFVQPGESQEAWRGCLAHRNIQPPPFLTMWRT